MDQNAPLPEPQNSSPYKDNSDLLATLEPVIEILGSLFWIVFITITTFGYDKSTIFYTCSWYYSFYILILIPLTIGLCKGVHYLLSEQPHDHEIVELLSNGIFVVSLVLLLLYFPFRFDAFINWEFVQQYGVNFDIIFGLIILVLILYYAIATWVRYRRIRGDLPTT